MGLDLQAVFERTYEAGPYAREIDYGRDTPQPPVPPPGEGGWRVMLDFVHRRYDTPAWQAWPGGRGAGAKCGGIARASK